MGTASGATNQRSSPGEKIALFRSLFRGREDVRARRFESRRAARHGYQPACANEWARGVCEKPRIKCSDCLAQSWLPLTDEVVRRHLSGRDDQARDFVAGVYPMLLDETCRLLAVDFDKASLAKEGLPPALRNRLLRLAAFQNREFLRAQAMRLPTWDEPRLVACAEDLPSHLALPRGCLEDLLALLAELRIQPWLADERFAGAPVDAAWAGARSTPPCEPSPTARADPAAGGFIAGGREPWDQPSCRGGSRWASSSW